MQVHFVCVYNRDLHKLEKVEESASSYVLKINIGERIYVLKTCYQLECNRWMEAVQLSSTTARELSRSKTQKSRNISKLLESYKSSKSTLEQILTAKYESLMPKGKSWDNPEELLDACNKVKDEFVIV